MNTRVGIGLHMNNGHLHSHEKLNGKLGIDLHKGLIYFLIFNFFCFLVSDKKKTFKNSIILLKKKYHKNLQDICL